MVESDHDMRNSADFISLDRVAKALIRLPGVAHGAEHHPAPGPTAGPRHHPLSVHHPGRRQGSATCRSTGSRTRNTDQQAQIQADTRGHAAARPSTSPRSCPTSCTTTVLTVREPAGCYRRGQLRTSPTSTTSSGRSRATSIGSQHCFDIPVCCGDEIAVRLASTGIDALDRTDPQRQDRDFAGRRRAVAADGRPAQDATATRPRPCRPTRSTPTGPAHLQSTQTDQTFDDQINVGNDFDKVPQRRLLLHARGRASTTRTSKPVCS